MNVRRIAVGSLVLGLTLAPSLAGAQTRSDGWTVPRTADGQPNLGGVWDFRTMTPLQRPQDQENPVLTEEEVAELEQRAAERVARAAAPSEVRTEPLPAGEPVGGYNRFWLDRGGRVVDDRRTSLIIDPPTGRVPDLQPGALRQVGSLSEDLPAERPVRYWSGGIYPNGPEDRGVSERCIVGFNSGPPLLPGGYNQNIQLFQTRDHVGVLSEMVHEARIVPLDGRPHLPNTVRQWLGDGRGYWDGDTLVIETENLSDQVAGFNAGFTTALGTGATVRLTGAVHAGRCRHAALRVHRRRSRHVHPTDHRGPAAAAGNVAAVRVRLSRRQLRHAERAVGRTHGGEGRQPGLASTWVLRAHPS